MKFIFLLLAVIGREINDRLIGHVAGGTRLALRTLRMKSLLMSGVASLWGLTLFATVCLAGDARVFVPVDELSAVHAERGFDVGAELVVDSAASEAAVEPSLILGAHLRVLEINPGFLVDRYVQVHAVSSVAGVGASGWNLEAGGELDGLICNKENHCFFYGASLGTDVSSLQNTEMPDPLVSAQVIAIKPGVGYLFTKDNKTIIVKTLGGLDLQAPRVLPGNGFELFADVGVSGQLLIGNKLMILAEVIRHFGLLDGRTQLTEGRLKLAVRLYHRPIDRYGDALSFKGVYWQFDLRGFTGDQVTSPDQVKGAAIPRYSPNEPSVVHHDSLAAITGLIIEY